ncbi:hypothetical protein LH433_12110 [Laribacter hongkongensis]|uniref:hypothetical protein n=1 Tax=Laribacter hongkongensis TaxID=168471 RepID=UPI001EFC3EF5|nr:hypothetical protein [Laribacter hongkongensis]MCG9107469.1 hypothetical protein [Laribacter hongkongensis]
MTTAMPDSVHAIHAGLRQEQAGRKRRMNIGATATGSLPVPASHPENHRLCACVCAGWSQKTIGQSRSSSTRPLDANRLRSRFFLDNLHLIVIHDSMNSSGAMSLYRLCPFTAKHDS